MASKYAELVAEEAEAAEGEDEDADEAPAEPSDEEADEAETTEEPETPEPAALAAIGEAEIRKAERARDAQRKRLAGILGEGYVAHECMFCSGLGYSPEQWPLGASLVIVQGDEGIGFTVEAPPADVPLKSAPDKAPCDECDGWGEVLTGARNPNALVAPCTRCNGNGWVTVARDAAVTPLPPVMSVTTGPQNGPPGVELPTDAWGRPAGHMHYGVPPSMITG